MSRIDMYNIPTVDINIFKQIYMDLVQIVRLISDKYNDGLDKYLDKMLKELTDYYNEIFETNVLAQPGEFTQKGVYNKSILFAAVLGKDNKMVIQSDIKGIKKFIEQIKSRNESEYNNTTFAIFLLGVIFHEFCHCVQFNDNFAYMSMQNYLNSMTKACDMSINYYERPYEGEAYGAGVNMLYYSLNHDLIPKEDANLFNEQMKYRKSFVSRNIGMDLLIHHLDRIPFMTSNGGFVPIIPYCNNILSKTGLKNVHDITRRFPLITLGLDSNDREKTVDELVEQYMTSTIRFGDQKISKMDDSELDGIADIYIYLLLPKLTAEIYELLCEKYGRDNMNNLILKMKSKIEEIKVEYHDAYNEALFWLSKLPRTILEIIKIDEKYVREKYKSSIIYLDNSMQIIDRCLINNSKVRESKYMKYE